MRKLLSLSLLALSLGVGSLSAQNGSRIMTIEEINAGVFSARPAGRGMRSMSDGLHYTMMDAGHRAILRYSFATGKLIDTLFSVDRARDCEFKRFDDYLLEPKGHHILLITNRESIYRRSWKGNAYHYDVRRNRIEPLSQDQGKVMIPTFSPDGKMVAFVREGNIFIKKFEFDTEVQVTNDAARNKVMNGVTDWVYEEELESTRLMSWSEDSGYLAFVRTDESEVSEYSMPLYGQGQYPTFYTYKYPKAGTPNSKVSLHIYNVTDRSRKEVSFREGAPYYIPRISFVGREGQLAVFTLNRQQNHLRLFYVQNKTLLPKLILEDKSKTYVDSHNITWCRFIPNGFVYPSERDGYRHLYHYSDKGTLLRQVTTGKYDVTNFYGADASGNLYYQAADESPMTRSIYRVDTKGKRTALHPDKGSNQAIFSDSFAYYISIFNSSTTPTRTAVYATGSLKPLRVLEDNQALQTKLSQYKVSPKEFITLTNAEGQEMNAWIVKPHGFNPSTKYPVLMVQYSGPDSQQVLDQYGYGWEQVLASQGFIVVCVDGRGTGARGEEWRKCTYLRLGVKESADQIAAAKALGRLSYVDPSRIAIWGWSFGGYNTLMSLCHGQGTFKVGIAVAPVTAWEFYDTIYTERFMRTPQENPDGYKASSVLEVAGNLQGKLLLIHGSADDNVHVQNSMDFAELLVQRDIPFDMALYTDKDHSIHGGKTRDHLYKKMISFLRTHL